MRVQRDNGYYFIRVKILSLVAEAKIIRQQEAKARAHGNLSLRVGLGDHRRGIVRHETRHALLAYGFLRGRTYKQMETKCHQLPHFGKIRATIEKYGCSFQLEGDETWNEFQARKKQILVDFDKWIEKAKTG